MAAATLSDAFIVSLARTGFIEVDTLAIATFLGPVGATVAVKTAVVGADALAAVAFFPTLTEFVATGADGARLIADGVHTGFVVPTCGAAT